MRRTALLTTLLLAVCSLSATAQRFTVDGFTYQPIGGDRVALVESSVQEGEVTLPQSVVNDGKTYVLTTIGESVFANSTITSVDMPTTVTKIGKEAFHYCMSLVTVKGTENVDSIMGQAFATCRQMKTMDWPKALKFVGPHAFTYDSSITFDLFLPRSITLEEGALEGMFNVGVITLDGQPAYVGAEAFSGLDALTTFNINAIYPPHFNPADAFSDGWGDPDLSSVTLYVPTGAKKNYEADKNWANIFGEIVEKDMENPDETGGNGGGGERKDSVLATEISPDSATIAMHVAEAGTLNETLTKKLQAKVHKLTLSGKLNGDDIILLRKLTGVGTDGYEIEDVTPILDTLDISLCDIVAGGDPYFVSSTGESYTEDDVVGANMFSGCPSLVSVTLPRYAERIGNDAFAYTQSLRYVGIGDRVKTIGQTAFYNSQIESIDLPDNIETLADMVFYNCEHLKQVKLPANLRALPFATFYFCIALTDVVMPESLTNIGNEAFWYCASLSQIHIPASVTNIDNTAFGHCLGMTAFEVDPANTTYKSEDGVLLNATGDILIQYPLGNSRTTYTTPESVANIGDMAFYQANHLSEVTLGENVSTLGGSAFNECKALKKVTVNATVPPACYGSDNITPFSGTDIAHAMLIVPDGSEDAYRAAPVWQDFGYITTPTAVRSVNVEGKSDETARFNLSGVRVNHATHGVTIVRTGDGSTRKVLTH